MKRLFLLAIVVSVLLSACDKNKDYLVIIHTEFGDMKAILYDETPLHKKNFIALAKEGKYDSTQWHRIIKDFMVQGGDIYAKDNTREPEGARIPAEINEKFQHTKGAIAAARQGDQVNPEKMSSSSQFYIVDGKVFSEAELTTNQMKLNQSISSMLQNPEYDSLKQLFMDLQQQGNYAGMNQLALDCKDYVEKELNVSLDKEVDPRLVETYTKIAGAPHLDKEYTVFGRVVEGLEIIDKLADVKVGPGDRPVEPTYMSVELEMVPKKEITKKYGYEYPDSK
ncbi:MAG: peptidylprolyl isomerase [Flammeovirgaceae bacterium]|nr:peptidylprolyl isomerase [Flammeovirgaceae bacterium]MBE63862.1 peptidylprolyl isomerase [Flammeovirgaceae bacterium]MBR08837.1 peptidylprolyl isomerase [Rickettsiales bacterium]HCX22580.1 peptidylprolyl isomerase [Cytophagales bacterium]|tara:strand:- start:1632 stop:2474 length:843 start_codon:yes stop_codon:yes gene_type:complete